MIPIFEADTVIEKLRDLDQPIYQLVTEHDT